MRERLRFLYGDDLGDRTASDLERLLDRFRQRLGRRGPGGPGFDERDAILITYGDTFLSPGEPPLGALGEFAARHLGERVSGVHILPFFPYSSDYGFSVIDYERVNPELLGDFFDDVFDVDDALGAAETAEGGVAGKVGFADSARDAEVGKTLALMHRDPARAWTLAMLAKEVGISRSVLAERFRHYLNETPIAYLTRWRLQLGAQMLSSTNHSVAQLASEVGYESEAAFNRAFKRRFEVPPARFRMKTRTAPVKVMN